jgi:hypothetical protein
MSVRSKRNSNYRKAFVIAFIVLIFLAVSVIAVYIFFGGDKPQPRFRYVQTAAGLGREFGEPFGVAVRDEIIYVSDGEAGSIKKIFSDGSVTVFA